MAARIIAVLVVLIVGFVIAYPYLRPYLERPPPPPESPRAEAPAPAKPAGPQFPIEAPAIPLPKLAESDAALFEALNMLFDSKAVQEFFNVEDFVRHVVATVDNLPRETVALRLNPVRPLGGSFLTSGRDDKLSIGERNAARYEPALRLFESADSTRLVDSYRHFYPLFQEAYVQLGYPNGYFNDRLVEVIDHLLEAPEPKGPVKLVAPKAMYEYADPDLESMSAGHKILVRMGLKNEARVKAKLRELRTKLVEQGKLGRQ